ncbi:MAG: hypothetical protein K2N74_00975 [Clostridiales bacterium]|nr:hypothetical protein [Clostridiales bacterium]
MSDGNQIFIFLVCVTCGLAGGVLYDALYCIRYPFRARWVKIVFDVFFFVLFAGIYLFVSVLFELPNLRLYMFFVCLVGLFLYLKSFHKIVAFFTEKVYNGVIRIKREARLCSKEKKRNTQKQKRVALHTSRQEKSQ